MLQETFDSLYRKLNPAQKQAVDAIEGPVMVVAGPGTGKTLVLTLRIANIRRLTDTPADAILALTFTKSAAHSMRERLTEIIGSDAYRVHINTFHGFCNDIIQRYPEEFPLIIGSKNVSGAEQIKLLAQVIEKSRLVRLKPFGDPLYYLYDVLSEIERLKKENLTPAAFRQLVTLRRREYRALPDKYHEVGPHRGKMKGRFIALDKELRKQEELARLYQAYEKSLRANKLYDFADMIMEVVAVLEDRPDFLRQLQEEYLYFLADEHQDANQAQNRLLELLAAFHPSPNLFIVGDEKQAIFQFQGASLENFAYFQKLYPAARLITLTENYRSGQTILDAAYSLMVQGPSLRARWARGRAGEKILIQSFNTTEEENRSVANHLAAKIRAKVPARELAVLFRDNQDGLALIPYLEEAGVPFGVESESNLLSDLTIGQLLLLFKTVHHFGDDEWLAQALLFDFFRLPALDVYRLITARRRQKVNLYDLISRPARLKKLGLERPERFQHLYRKLIDWQRLAHNESLIRFFGAVIEGSGILNSVFRRPESLATLRKLRAFYNELKNLVLHHPHYRLPDLLSYLETFEKHGLVLREAIDPLHQGVRLMTVHKAKGLEFDYVFIINAQDGHFGNRRRRAAFNLSLRNAGLLPENEIESERRLFYVALTRARKQVVITYAKEDREGRIRLPSQFIAEIRDELKETQDVVPGDDPRSAFMVEKKIGRFRAPFAEKSYLNSLFIARGVSVTDLNNYLACPLKYFFLNLLQVVRVQTKSQLYGTAVHAALKDFFERYRLGRGLSRAYLLKQLKYHLARQPLTGRDFEEVWAKGRAALCSYFDFYRGTWRKQIINEFIVRGVFLTPELKLRGRLDKIEFLGQGQEVNVVDYKTSQPKSRREILGLTKNATGDYRRQLIFYKILLNLYPGRKLAVVSGTLDFIEPQKGKHKKEVLGINSDDVKEIEELIKETAAEILSLSFLQRGCGKPDCRWCRLWSMSSRKFYPTSFAKDGF